MNIIRVKINNQEYEEILAGKKRTVLVKGEEKPKPKDKLMLYEWEQEQFTGRVMHKKVLCVKIHKVNYFIVAFEDEKSI